MLYVQGQGRHRLPVSLCSLSAEQLQTVTRHVSSQIAISCDLFALYSV